MRRELDQLVLSFSMIQNFFTRTKIDFYSFKIKLSNFTQNHVSHSWLKEILKYHFYIGLSKKIKKPIKSRKPEKKTKETEP